MPKGVLRESKDGKGFDFQLIGNKAYCSIHVSGSVGNQNHYILKRKIKLPDAGTPRGYDLDVAHGEQEAYQMAYEHARRMLNDLTSGDFTDETQFAKQQSLEQRAQPESKNLLAGAPVTVHFQPKPGQTRDPFLSDADIDDIFER